MNLKNYENNLLQQLCLEMIKEVQNCPEELKKYFIQEDSLSISKAISILSKDIEELGNALSRGLTRIGKNKEWYFRLMDKKF